MRHNQHHKHNIVDRGMSPLQLGIALKLRYEKLWQVLIGVLIAKSVLAFILILYPSLLYISYLEDH